MYVLLFQSVDICELIWYAIIIEHTFYNNREVKMGKIEDIFSAAFWDNDLQLTSHWIEWQHVSRGITHCPVCLSLDKCWFADDNKPILPQHEYCHCITEAITAPKPEVTAFADCSIDKFTKYIFSDKYAWNGKRALFEALGFNTEDSQQLKEIFEKQAVYKYTEGKYKLTKLDRNGQRINIEVEIERDGKTPAKFISGWMVRPKGRITNNTPLGDR